MSDTPFLVCESVSKRFGLTQALDAVSVGFRAGEVHALMGENGAGKSTLGKIIAGLVRQDSGTIVVGGRVLQPGSIDEAYAAGIRIVHQELAQCPNLTVAENLCLHDLPRTRAGFVDYRRMAERAARLVHRLEPDIDVEAPLGLLPPGRRQIVQIASSLDDEAGGRSGGEGRSRARVIVFDEPTSSLSVHETERLLGIIRRLAAEGITIVYVSHRMGEIFAVCDRVTVLRDGRFVATSEVGRVDEPSLVEQMIGRRLERTAKRTPPTPSPGAVPRLEVRGLSSPGLLHDVSFTVHSGEVLGIGGLVGSGRSEVLNAIFGLDSRSRGTVTVDGKALDRSSARGAIRAGVGYVPEDRRLQGLFFDLGVDENILMPFMSRLARALGIRSHSRERALVGEKVRDFRVKAAGLSVGPGTLSGGNQQKLLIARWMGRDTRVLLLDEPTRGIDVGTKAEVHRLVLEAADAGAAVVVVSSEMPELLALSDRVVVMNQGRVRGELSGESMTQANILRLATIED